MLIASDRNPRVRGCRVDVLAALLVAHVIHVPSFGLKRTTRLCTISHFSHRNRPAGRSGRGRARGGSGCHYITDGGEWRRTLRDCRAANPPCDTSPTHGDGPQRQLRLSLTTWHRRSRARSSGTTP